MEKYFVVNVEDHFVRRSQVTIKAESEMELDEIIEYYEDDIFMDDQYRYGSGSYIDINDVKEISDPSEIDTSNILDRSEYDEKFAEV